MKDKYICKFCGAEVHYTVRYLNQATKEHICSKCGSYCMSQCKIASSVKGWHYEPCTSCTHNPYQGKYEFKEGKWILKTLSYGS